MRTLRAAALLTLLLATPLSAVSPAHAAGDRDTMTERARAAFAAGRDRVQEATTNVGDDPLDASDKRGDIVRTAVSYSGNRITASTEVAQGVNPATNVNWRDGDTGILVFISTDGDNVEEWVAGMIFDPDANALVGDVTDDVGNVACGGGGVTATWDGHTSYRMVIDAGCIGSPATIRYGTYMAFHVNVASDEPTVFSEDIAPNTDMSPAIARSEGPGYWLLGADGGVFSYGRAPFYGSTGNLTLNKPVVGMAAKPGGGGYWFVATDGGIFAYGTSGFFGSTGAITLNKPVVGMAATPSGQGYWLVASDGGIFAYGDARFHGSTGALALNKPIVGMARTPSGAGYWLVASDGGIFAFGDAKFHGSTGALPLNQPIVDIATTPAGNGYWLGAADGGIFAFGDVGFYGSAAKGTLPAPIVGMSNSVEGGYWMVSSQGRVYPNPAHGDLGGAIPNKPIVDIQEAA